jgi:hypothetical protein
MFALLERAFRAANSADVGFSTWLFTGAPATENRFSTIAQLFLADCVVPYTKMFGLVRPNLSEQPHSYSAHHTHAKIT